MLQVDWAVPPPLVHKPWGRANEVMVPGISPWHESEHDCAYQLLAANQAASCFPCFHYGQIASVFEKLFGMCFKCKGLGSMFEVPPTCRLVAFMETNHYVQESI